MRKTTFQRVTTKRIQEAAPELKYVALYHRDEERLNACMRNYEDRSFVYVMTAMYEEKEYYLYVGKTQAQYARHLTHSKKYAYDNIYLFECKPEQLGDCEKAVIKALAPLFNRSCNPKLEQFKLLLEIDYDEVFDTERIQTLLKKYSDYEVRGLFGFALPAAVFLALEKESVAAGSSSSELLMQILEKHLGKKIKAELERGEVLGTNLISAKDFGRKYGRSEEQAKQYCHQKGRVLGAVRVGRDWVIPRDTKYPEMLRRKSKKSGKGEETV